MRNVKPSRPALRSGVAFGGKTIAKVSAVEQHSSRTLLRACKGRFFGPSAWLCASKTQCFQVISRDVWVKTYGSDVRPPSSSQPTPFGSAACSHHCTSHAALHPRNGFNAFKQPSICLWVMEIEGDVDQSFPAATVTGHAKAAATGLGLHHVNHLAVLRIRELGHVQA